MAADEAHVVEERAGAGAPLDAERAAVDAGVDPEAGDDVGATGRGGEQGNGRAEAREGGGLVSQDDLGGEGAESDQVRVGPEFDRRGHAVAAGGKEEGLVGDERGLERSRVVGHAVTDRAKIAHTHPGVARRQGGDLGGDQRGNGGEGAEVVGGVDLGRGAEVGEVVAVGERIDQIGRARARDLPATAAEGSEDGCPDRDDVDEVELGPGIVLVADDEGRAGNVLEPRIADEELLRAIGRDQDGGGDVLELAADDGHAGLLGLDGGDPLAGEGGVHQHERPAWGRLRGDDAEVAAKEADVLHLVADLLDARAALADPKIHVGEVAVLGDVEAHADGGGIARADLEVEIAHRAVERPRIGGADRLAGSGTVADKIDQVGPVPGLEPGGVLAEEENRPGGTGADEADALPHMQGGAEAVGAGRDQDDAVPGALLDAVDGGLQGGGVVRHAVADRAEIGAGEQHGARVVRQGRVE